MAWTYNEETQVYTVPFSELDDLLSSLSENTKNTAYKLNVTELTVENVAESSRSGTIGYVLIKNETKYVDLNETSIPDSATDINHCFAECTSLVEPPSISNHVTNMTACFNECTSLKTAPTIPHTVTDIRYCFAGCTSLETAPVIPGSITNMYACFNGCSSLKTAPVIPDQVDNLQLCFTQCRKLVTVPVIPDSITNITGCFGGCVSLKEISSWNNADNITKLNDAFYGCSSLEHIYTDNPYTELLLELFLEGCKTDAKVTFDIKKVVKSRTIGIPFRLLESYLTALPENTKDTPYKLNVTELTEENIGASSSENTLGFVFRQNNTKYVDLEETVLPSVEYMRNCFGGCSGLVTAPVIPDSVTDMYSCFGNCTSLITAPVIPDSVIFMGNCFYSCTSLTIVPNIPDSVTTMKDCFRNCTSLTTVPNISDSVTNMNSCFRNCTSLKKINSWNNMSNIYDIYSAFYQCPSLEYIGTDNLYTEQQLENYLESNKTGAGITFNIKEVVQAKSNTIKFENLRDYVSTADSNTSDTPYKLTVVDINEGDHFTNAIGESATAYNVFLDLSDTVLPERKNYNNEFYYCLRLVKAPSIPDGTKSLAYAFSNCLSLTEVPSIPDSVENMAYTFANCSKITQARISNNATNINSCFNNCTALINAGDIPDSVTDMRNTFSGCSALTEAKIGKNASNFMNTFRFCTSITTIDSLPAGKESYKSMFEGCTSLTTIYGFELSYEDLNNGVYDTTDMFKGCTSLADIFIDKPTLTESDSWKLVRIDAESDTASVYSSEGVLEYTVPVSVDKYKKYELEGYIDEIVVAESGQITDEIIEKFFKYQKPFTNDPSKSLNPADANFVLWAKDPDSVVSNILNGGGGGSALVPSITQDEYDKIPNKMDGQIREIIDATEEEPFINVLYEQAPIGSFFPFGGDSAPIGFLMCKGQEVSREAYADLFAVIGTKYGEGDGETTFNLPNITDEAKLDIEYMTGKRDTDGRPIYLKIYKSITTTSASNWGNVSNDVIENVQNIKNGYVSRVDKSGYSCLLRISGNRLQCYIANAGISVNDLVTVEYTKTTDTADTFCYKQIDGSTYCIKSTKTSGELAPDIEVDDNKVTNTNVMSAQKTMETLGFEMGSNENGFYRKWANGLLECWGRVEGTFNHETNYTYNLPISYIGNASVSLTPNKLTDTSNNETMHGDIVDGNILTIRHHRAGGGTYIGAISYFAIGFWK